MQIFQYQLSKLLDQLKKALASMVESLDAYSGYFKYAQNRDESNVDPVVNRITQS